MHINCKPGKQVEVDWTVEPATIISSDTGEIIKTYTFVGVMTYSQYTYVEACLVIFGMLKYRKDKKKFIEFIEQNKKFFITMDLETAQAMAEMLHFQMIMKLNKLSKS